MDLEILQLNLVFLLVCSYLAMPLYTFDHEKKRRNVQFLHHFSSFNISDYIKLTREQTGAIGGWLWVFAISIVLLISVSIISIATPDEQSDLTFRQQVTQELFPIL